MIGRHDIVMRYEPAEYGGLAIAFLHQMPLAGLGRIRP